MKTHSQRLTKFMESGDNRFVCPDYVSTRAVHAFLQSRVKFDDINAVMEEMGFVRPCIIRKARLLEKAGVRTMYTEIRMKVTKAFADGATGDALADKVISDLRLEGFVPARDDPYDGRIKNHHKDVFDALADK